MSSPEFYKNLPAVNDFKKITDSSLYVPVPENWIVAMTDVVSSTRAIQEGRYKDVNRAGAIAIMALSNIFADLDLPFIFGGDGVTFLMPDSVLPQAKDALADTRNMVKNVFNLDLRVGFVPVKDLYARNVALGLAKFQISKLYNQAMFSGEGIELAEVLVKEPGNPYLLPADYPLKNVADFSGFNCRWQDIKSHRGETVSIIVKPMSPDVINRFLVALQNTVGDENASHPISADFMHLGGAGGMQVEARVNAGTGLPGLIYKIKTTLMLKMGEVIMNRKIRGKVSVNGYDLVDLKQNMIGSTDYRKFDGTLKMVFACTEAQRKEITAFLEKEKQSGSLAYGIHISDRALMTCLINEGTSREVHFVDAADGGYAMAARMLKEQIASVKS